MEKSRESVTAKLCLAVLKGINDKVNMEQSIVETGLKFRWAKGGEQHDVVGLIDGHEVLNVEQGKLGTYVIHYAEELKGLDGFDRGGYEMAIHDIIDDYLNHDKHALKASQPSPDKGGCE